MNRSATGRDFSLITLLRNWGCGRVRGRSADVVPSAAAVAIPYGFPDVIRHSGGNREKTPDRNARPAAPHCVWHIPR
jgi:hypothetical protein